jgi:hypothetical protein
MRTDRTVSTLPATAALPAVAIDPATAALPAVTIDPATAALPAVTIDPATAALPAVRREPATAALPAVEREPTTATEFFLAMGPSQLIGAPVVRSSMTKRETPAQRGRSRSVQSLRTHDHVDPDGRRTPVST